MVSGAGTLLSQAVANNPYDWEGMDKTERYLIENEWTGVGWYWSQGGKQIVGTFGSSERPKKKEKSIKNPPFDWRKRKENF